MCQFWFSLFYLYFQSKRVISSELLYPNSSSYDLAKCSQSKELWHTIVQNLVYAQCIQQIYHCYTNRQTEQFNRFYRDSRSCCQWHVIPILYTRMCNKLKPLGFEWLPLFLCRFTVFGSQLFRFDLHYSVHSIHWSKSSHGTVGSSVREESMSKGRSRV